MLTAQREKLAASAGGYLSIGITEGGNPRCSIGVPWVQTVHAYNMRLPDVYLAPEDLLDGEIMHLVSTCRVIGCYIWEPLADYSFLKQFPDLQDLSIKNGEAVRDLEFLRALPECRMLFLQKARLENLDVIPELKKQSKLPGGCLGCICLDGCKVGDLSAFEREKVRFSEFLVCGGEGEEGMEKWGVIDASTFRLYPWKK